MKNAVLDLRIKNAILEKLRTHLAEPVDTECKAMYLLCQTRKLLPTDDPPTATLRLHCNWALHVDLHVPMTTLPFLRKVDTFVSNALNIPSVTIMVDPDGNTTCHFFDDPVLADFVYLATFKKDLAEFLVDNRLPTSLCDDDARWLGFLNSYAGVIEDGSLTCENSDELALVKKVIFSKGRQVDKAHLPFTIKWDIRLKDGRRLEVEVGAPPDLKGRWWSRRLQAVPTT
jgi:hypothetical protein